jgi:hypothetical protein
MHITLDSEEIRYILQNAGEIKRNGKCIECDGTGWINYDYNGQDTKSGQSYDMDRVNEECQECQGVGYKW